MNEQIINNLYEFWEHIGNCNNILTKTENYSCISVQDSDWPNRIFNLKQSTSPSARIIDLSQEGKLPDVVTIKKPNKFRHQRYSEFIFGQKNMALSLHSFTSSVSASKNIKRVTTETDAIDFAETASASFGYRVDYKIIVNIVKHSKTTRLLLYTEHNKSLGCGIVFFDSNNNAGLHMIGTRPEGRGKGIGRSITENLLQEAKENNAQLCVLHASLMGEPIYSKLGFETYGEIETYRILKPGYDDSTNNLTQAQFSDLLSDYFISNFNHIKFEKKTHNDSTIDFEIKSPSGKLTLWASSMGREISIGFEDTNGNSDWHTHMSLFGANSPNEQLKTMSNFIKEIVNDKEKIAYKIAYGYYLIDNLKEEGKLVTLSKWSEL